MSPLPTDAELMNDDSPDYHARIKALHDKDEEITRSAGLPANPCGCFSCNFVRTRNGVPEESGNTPSSSTLFPVPSPAPAPAARKLTRRNIPATKAQHSAGDSPMSKPAKAKKSAAPSPKVAQKSKPRKHAPAKPAAAPAAKKSAAKIPRFVPSIKERGHAIMFRVSPDEMALIVDDATKHKDRSLSAAMRRRLGFS